MSDLEGVVELYCKIIMIDLQYDEVYFNLGFLYFDMDLVAKVE